MRIKELDGLRGIAVLAVMGEHYMSWLPAIGSQFGWLGVDLFFILSGFLITSILLDLRNKEHYFKVFYARRAFRIFPPYFLGIFVYATYSIAVGLPGTWSLWLQYIFYYTSLFVGQPPTLHAHPPIIPEVVAVGLAVLWSLSVEEIYYTIWAPIVRYTTQRSFAAILLFMFVAAPVFRWFLHTPLYPEMYTFYCRMDGLAYGSAVALLIRERRLHPDKWIRLDKFFDWAALVTFVSAIVLFAVTQGRLSNRVVTTFGITAADIAFALVAHTLVRNANGTQFLARALRAKWLRSIGMVSYSLYLFHYPMRLIGGGLVTRLHLSRHADAIASVLVGVALSFGVAYGLWYGMESRILRWKDRSVPSPAHV